PSQPTPPEAVLSGTPTTAGAMAFTLQVIDEGQGHLLAQQAFIITISREPPLICPWGLGPDSDGDGVPDGTEANQGTDPFAKDNNIFGDPVGFIAQLYRDLLHREPDAAGLTNWLAALRTGQATRGGVIEGFYQSGEFQNGPGAIARLYQAALNRTPDACELAGGVAQWQQGQALADIAKALIASPAFLAQGLADATAFITALHHHVFNRPPSPARLTYWLRQIEQGADWGDVLLAFTQTAPVGTALVHPVQVDFYYRGFLNRDPDAPGYAHWVQALNQTRDPGLVHEAFQAASEYRYRVLGPAGLIR
ncbi:MAG: hypothetical protein QG599_3132, partial [Pseudomonadota bacterium]|nr:hypothetical protein [Pseudomonadota bacterium]